MNKQSLISFSILTLFLIMAAGSSDDRTPEEKAKDDCEDTTMAFIMTQGFVADQLKSPASADFPYAHDNGVKIVYQGDCKHKVWAYVDAQNSFGALMRTKYYAEIQNEYGKDTWRLLDIQM